MAGLGDSAQEGRGPYGDSWDMHSMRGATDWLAQRKLRPQDGEKFGQSSEGVSTSAPDASEEGLCGCPYEEGAQWALHKCCGEGIHPSWPGNDVVSAPSHF